MNELDGPISWVRDTSEEDAEAEQKKVWSLTCWCAAEKSNEVWDWISSSYAADDDSAELQKENWAENPVVMHLVRGFGERVEALGRRIPAPRGDLFLVVRRRRRRERRRRRRRRRRKGIRMTSTLHSRLEHGIG